MTKSCVAVLLVVTAAMTAHAAGRLLSPPPPARSSCVAIALPSVQGVEGDATAFSTSTRELVASFLRGPSMEAVLLDARLATHALEEALQKNCPHVLTMTVTRKRDAGGGNLIGSVVGQAGSSMAWSLPMGNVGGAVARGVTVATTQAISEMASSTRVRDELRLDYSVTTVEGKLRLGPKMEKAKARVDGEDLLTPIVERAAEAIVRAVK
jgi:hypothetical protein